MEVDEIRRLALREKKAHDIIKPISEQISAERNRAIDRDIFGEQAFKPLVRMQEKVQRELRNADKKGIDERQDALIGKLEENQKIIADSVSNVLTVDVNEFLRKFTPPELEKLQSKIGINVADLNELTNEKLNEVMMGVRVVLTNTKKKAYRNRDQVYVSALEKLIDTINAMIALREHMTYKTTITKGSGTRSYKQPKRHAYKISQGQYGGLSINVPRLMNEMIVEATKDGRKIYENMADRSLIDLLTKRFDPKKRYSSMARQVFNDLNMISGIPIHRSSGKSKLGSGNVYYSKAEDLIKRLKLLTGTRAAGNNNLQIRNEIWQIIDHLHKSGEISKEQHNSYVNKFLI